MTPEQFKQGKLRVTANIAEYAAMYGIPYEAAVGIFTLCGHSHITRHINSRRMMPC